MSNRALAWSPPRGAREARRPKPAHANADAGSRETPIIDGLTFKPTLSGAAWLQEVLLDESLRPKICFAGLMRSSWY